MWYKKIVVNKVGDEKKMVIPISLWQKLNSDCHKTLNVVKLKLQLLQNINNQNAEREKLRNWNCDKILSLQKNLIKLKNLHFDIKK